MKKTAWGTILLSWLSLGFAFAHAAEYTLMLLDNAEGFVLDGEPKEESWLRARALSELTMVEPVLNGISEYETEIRLMADERFIYIGIICRDPEPGRIISIAKAHDADMDNEDHVKFVFDTASDKRSGYIFAVNPAGARYEALVSNYGEGENDSWDCIWDAQTRLRPDGWSAEIVIPVRSLSFPSGARHWGFNIERRIQRNMEVQRWTGLKPDYKVGMVVHAGLLKGLPRFDTGVGLNIRLSGIADFSRSPANGNRSDLDYSLDLSQKITGNIGAHLTVNTDFAETEVDSRSSNLTRFPLYYPEKRGFFLEGADIFDFGLGTGTDVLPFFSRRIGLVDGEKVPLKLGAKLSGKLRDSQFAALLTRTGPLNQEIGATSMGAFRYRHNLWQESSLGLIGTFGDPVGLDSSWLLGLDFTFQSSRFFGDKNFLAGIWALLNHNPSLGDDQSALGFKIDYPNDLWDVALTVKRIGDDFAPSLGFVPRRGIISTSVGINFMPRPDWSLVRQLFFESSFRLITDLHNQWESYRLFTAPLHVLLESGDRFEFNIAPEGENLPQDFQISEGVVISADAHHWCRYRLEFESAPKRPVSAELSWWFGSFYDGLLDEIELELMLRPAKQINLSLNYEKNIARLKGGRFTQDLLGTKLQIGLGPHFQLSSFVQYDTESGSIGSNSRLHWKFGMNSELFIVYNHNIDTASSRSWLFDSNQFIVKFSTSLGL